MAEKRTTLRRSGCTLAVEIDESRTGDTVVLLHSFGMSRSALRPLATSLRETGAAARTLLFDARGHGETSVRGRDDEYRYPAMRDDLHALIEREAASGVHLVGHSMGGQIALMATIAWPEQVRSLSLIGAGPCRAVVTEKEKRIWQRAAAAFEAASPEQLRDSLASAAPTKHAELTPDRLYGDARGPDLARVIRGAFLEVESNDDACGGLRTPALVIAGSEDRSWLEPSRQLAAVVPNSTLRVVEGAGHLVHLEHPEDCASWIADFIRTHSGDE